MSNSQTYEGYVARLIRGDKECQVLLDSQYEEPICFKVASDFSVLPMLNLGDSVEVEYKEDGNETIVTAIKITALADEECQDEEEACGGEPDETGFWLKFGGKVVGYTFCSCGLLAAYFMPGVRDAIILGTGVLAFLVTLFA